MISSDDCYSLHFEEHELRALLRDLENIYSVYLHSSPKPDMTRIVSVLNLMPAIRNMLHKEEDV